MSKELEVEQSIWEEMSHTKHTLADCLDKLLSRLPLDATLMVINPTCSQPIDGVFQQMFKKLDSDWTVISNKRTDCQKPFFQFRDGPVTKAAKLGQLLFLEDFNLPSQVLRNVSCIHTIFIKTEQLILIVNYSYRL
jgi:hypothetical protein